MPPADNTPDFDKMSPEEIMAWMESLAKRQGANEGFTTAADMDVPEVDPNTVVIDEPGYVPSEGKMKGQKIGPGVPIARPAQPSAPVVSKPVETPPPATVQQVPLPIEPAAVQPAARVPEPPPIAPPPAIAPAAQGTLSWLESLAADQGPSLDFSLEAFAAPAAPSKKEEPSVATTDWLADLARVSDLTEAAAPDPVIPVPEASVPADTVSWLETLASEEGAAAEELVAPAPIDIPTPTAVIDDGPGYTDYAFDTPAFTSRTEPIPAQVLPEPFLSEEPPPQDAAAWLDQLASAQKPGAALPPSPEPMDDNSIQAALARGENIPHDEMEAWMQRQLQIGAKRPDPDIGDADLEAPAVPAALPDWLLDQVGPPPPLDEAPPPAQVQPALIEAIFEPPAVQQSDLPDWLREDSDSISSLDDIFATNEQPQVEAPPTIISAPAAGLSAVDMSDPWVEALEMEYQAAHGGVMPMPVAPIPDATPQVTLTAAEFPLEADLTPGELEPAPDWLTGLMPDITAVPAEMDAERTALIEVDPVAIRAEAIEDMPDWLQDNMPAASEETQLPAEVSASIDEISSWLETIELEPAEIPTWLTETINPPAAPPPAPVTPAPVAEPAGIFAPAAAALAPVGTRIANAVVDAVAALTSARNRYNENDLEGSLNDYDTLVRSNQSLDEVVTDLTKAVEKHKGNPTVYRVLGDGLMRQGKLQAALDTYRKALNQL